MYVIKTWKQKNIVDATKEISFLNFEKQVNLNHTVLLCANQFCMLNKIIIFFELKNIKTVMTSTSSDAEFFHMIHKNINPYMNLWQITKIWRLNNILPISLNKVSFWEFQ